MLLILKLLGARVGEGVGGRSRFVVASLLGMTSVERERGAGWAALRFGSLTFTLLIWGWCFC